MKKFTAPRETAGIQEEIVISRDVLSKPKTRLGRIKIWSILRCVEDDVNYLTTFRKRMSIFRTKKTH